MTKEIPFPAAAYSPGFILLCGTWYGFHVTPELRTGRYLRAWKSWGSGWAPTYKATIVCSVSVEKDWWEGYSKPRKDQMTQKVWQRSPSLATVRGLRDKFTPHPALQMQEQKPGMLEDETTPKSRSIPQQSHDEVGQTLWQRYRRRCQGQVLGSPGSSVCSPMLTGANWSTGTHRAASKAQGNTLPSSAA